MNLEYIRHYYKVPAEIGRRIKYGDKTGIIVSDLGGYIGVNFDHTSPTLVLPLHPTYNVEYLEMGRIRKTTASQRRYQRYKDADWFSGSFFEYLKYEQEQRKK